jgi:LemA protein
MKLLVLALAALALVFGSKCITIRKNLEAERAVVDADWSQTEEALDRRADLIPELVEAVRSAAPQETIALLGATDSRNLLLAAHGPQEKIQANVRLDEALARLMMAVETHPKLEASQQYAGLLDGLNDADYHIAVARRKYNEAVEHYNAQIELFPNNVVASVARFNKINAYFRTPVSAPAAAEIP